MNLHGPVLSDRLMVRPFHNDDQPGFVRFITMPEATRVLTFTDEHQTDPGAEELSKRRFEQEAVNLLLQHAFQEMCIPTMVAFVDPDHSPAQILADKIGLLRTGVILRPDQGQVAFDLRGRIHLEQESTPTNNQTERHHGKP